jgi:hypothetical protein
MKDEARCETLVVLFGYLECCAERYKEHERLCEN